MKTLTKQQIWKDILDRGFCQEDSCGNRPCDNGCICDECSCKAARDEYKERVIKAGLTLTK